MTPNMRSWWERRERCRFYAPSGRRLGYPRFQPERWIGSFKRFLTIAPPVTFKRVYVPKSMPRQRRRVRSIN